MRHCTIGDLCDSGLADLQTGPFGSQLHASDYADAGTAVVPTEAIRERRIEHSLLPRVSEAKAYELRRHRLKTDDILFARRGAQATGRVALVRQSEEGFLCGTGAIRLRLGGGVSSDYVSHILSSPATHAWLRTHAIGATMPNLNKAVIRLVPMRLPSLPEQRAVARFLSAFDDKIELNRLTNRTLESIGHAVFKSWFVDFDPVRRKIEGSEGGLPPDRAALFSDALGPSVVGPVPRGWRVSEIGREVEAVGGSTPSTGNADYWGGPIGFATPRDLADISAPALLHTERSLSPAGAATISSGVLEPGAVLMSSRAPIGYVALNEIPVCVNQGFIAMKCVHSLPNHYVMHWIRHNLESIVGNANGTTFLEISKRSFRPLPVVVPPRRLLDRFVDLVGPVHERVVNNLKESETLAQTRDALLPRLLSGELAASASSPSNPVCV